MKNFSYYRKNNKSEDRGKKQMAAAFRWKRRLRGSFAGLTVLLLVLLLCGCSHLFEDDMLLPDQEEAASDMPAAEETTAPEEETAVPEEEIAAQETEIAAPETEAAAPEADPNYADSDTGTDSGSTGSDIPVSSPSDSPAPPASSAAYDIASNLVVRLTNGYGLVQSDYFNLVMDYEDMANGLWEIIPNNEYSISFYYSKAKASGYGGKVFSLMAFDWGDNSYSDFPAYSVAGVSNDKKYIILYPTDLQYDGSDSVQASEYQRLSEYASHINDHDSSNPFSALP